MDFLTKKTFELSQDELQQLVSLFEEVFERESSVEEFMNSYTRNYLGYSFHTLIINEAGIVGSNSLIPMEYIIDGKTVKWVNSGGTMISKTCRGLENFYDMIKESYRNAELEGFTACTGFPNDNSYPLFKGTRLMKDIGKMHTYILPYRVGGIKNNLGTFNPLSKFFCRCYLTMSGWFASKKVFEFRIQKENNRFGELRFGNPAYGKFDVGNGKVYYRVTIHEGVRTAFLIDITEKSEKNFTLAVKEILKRENSKMDLILYIGNLPFSHHGLIRMPRKFEPKNFNFTGQIFDNKVIDKKTFFDFSSWDVNLSNYDLI